MSFEQDNYIYYEDEPNESLLSMLGLTDETEYRQPLFFGEDASALWGRSPDYPTYRTWKDYQQQEFPQPYLKDYITEYDSGGNPIIDYESYNADLKEYQRKSSLY